MVSPSGLSSPPNPGLEASMSVMMRAGRIDGIDFVLWEFFGNNKFKP
jgi:hypothetical protein